MEPPVAKERHQLALLSRTRDYFQSLSRLQRELMFIGVAVVFGFVVMPAIIFALGTGVMGKYAGGNSVISLYTNFYKALGQGWLSFWIVALGPFVLISLLRLLIAMLFGGSADEADTETRAPPKRRAPQVSDETRAPPTRRAPQLSDDRRAPPTEGRRPPPPQPNRAPPVQPQPPRKAPPKPGERRTPFIKSID
jgi:hypothetical protein